MRLRAPRLDELVLLSDLCLRSKAVRGYPQDMLERFRRQLMLSQDDGREDAIVVADDLRGIAGVVEAAFDGDVAVLAKLFVQP